MPQKTLFLGVSITQLPGNVRIWIGKLRKEHWSNPLNVWAKRMGKRQLDPFTFSLGHQLPMLCPLHPGWFCQLTLGSSWDSTVSIMSANSHSKSAIKTLSINLCLQGHLTEVEGRILWNLRKGSICTFPPFLAEGIRSPLQCQTWTSSKRYSHASFCFLGLSHWEE